MSDDIDWGEASTLGDVRKPTLIRKEPRFDPEITKILGKPVLVNDPRLISLVVRFKKEHGNSPDIDRLDNYLHNPDFLVELRKIFG